MERAPNHFCVPAALKYGHEFRVTSIREKHKLLNLGCFYSLPIDAMQRLSNNRRLIIAFLAFIDHAPSRY